MASTDWNMKLNPSVEIMRMQRRKIYECENTIFKEIADRRQNCSHINGLMYQLKFLYKMHFMYEEQLLEELNVPAAAEQKKIHDLFLKSFDNLKAEDGQCHTSSYIFDFINLRLEFVSNMNKETMMLCDFIKNISGGDTEDNKDVEGHNAW